MKLLYNCRITRTNRGSAIILSLSFITALFFFAIGYMNLIPSELRFSRRNQLNVKGYFVADAGIIHALSWIESTLTAGLEPGSSLSSYTGKVKLDDDWSFRVHIEPDEDTPPRGINPVRAYVLTSQAFERGHLRKQISVQVVQKSFARYAMFMDRWPTNIIYNLGSAGVDGPMHTNDILRLHVPYERYWSEKNQKPMFLGEVTASKVFHNRKHGAAQDGIAYYRGNYSGDIKWKRPYDEDGPLAEHYQRMVAGGRENLTAGVQKEPLPKNSLDLAQAAWGDKERGRPDQPSGKPRVFLNQGAGIYVNGKIDEMRLAVVNDNPVTAIVQNKGRQVTYIIEATDSDVLIPKGTELDGRRIRKDVRVPKGSTLTLVEEASRGVDVSLDRWGKRIPGPKNGFKAEIHKELPNGVIFANDDIDALSGELKGQKTIAVEVNRSDKIFVSGNLTLHGTPPGNRPESAKDALGLVAYDVMVSKSVPRHQTSRSKPLYIYAQILAGRDNGQGGFGVEDYNRGRSRGYMEIFGGIVQSNLKPWAVLNGGGMSGRIVYNPIGGDNPPPHFPTLSKFKIRAYLEEVKG